MPARSRSSGTGTALAPNATIGILGGGQLGRMMALAAAALGYRCHIYCPEADSPAAQVSAAATVAAYDDRAALDRFAAEIDVATLEFENIPVATVDHVARKVAVHPGAGVLRITQDRLLEKDFIRKAGGGTADYAAVDSLGDLQAALKRLGAPAILKTRRMGYDGRGQVKIGSVAEAEAAWQQLAPQPCILEAFVPFAAECSVIVARGQDGATAAYVPVENRHEHHILSATLAPARLAPATMQAADALARRIAGELGVIGLLAVELFVGADGGILVNELAPRVHNSGHWTIEGCHTSQFEQAIRCAAGLPLGDPAAHCDAIMRNLIGSQIDDVPALLADPRAKVHLYGKTEARPGRKMGHVTWRYPAGQRPDG